MPQIELPIFDRTYFIFTTHPTQADLDRAKRQEKLVVVTVHKPDVSRPVTISEGDIFCDGLLKAWGLTGDSRMVILGVPPAMDLESAREAWVEEVMKHKDEPWWAPAGVNRTSMRAAAP